MNARRRPRRARWAAGSALAVALLALVVLLASNRTGRTHPAEAPVSRAHATVTGRQFPNPSNTGVPAGWTPRRTRSRDMVVTRPGAVVDGTRFIRGARLTVAAENVTVRDAEFQGGWIQSDGYPGLRIENVTIDRRGAEAEAGEGVVSYCNYTAVRVEILDRGEGFRESCAPGTTTTIRDSFIRIAPPGDCAEWHGDGIQGYGGVNLHVRNVTIDFRETRRCQGTAPFFYVGGPGGSPHGHVHVDGLLIRGGGYSFRMGTPGAVRGLNIVARSWRYAPLDITGAGCAAIDPWQAQIVEVDPAWRVTRTVRRLTCRGA